MVDLSGLRLEATLPVLILAVGACLLFVLDLSVKPENKNRTAGFAIGTMIVAFIAALPGFNQDISAMNGMFRADSFTTLINIIALVTGFMSVLVAHEYLKRTKIERGEYYPLIMISTAGAMLMGAAADLIIVLIALELLSIPLYVMAGFRRPDPRSEESAMKYFLLGAFASGFLVYGIALAYGATGTTNLAGIFAKVQANELTSPFLLLIGAALILVSLGFKVAAVPFHTWTPDVYQGAPTPVTAFMSVIAKVGGFGALMRVFTIGLPVFLAATVDVPPGQTVTLHAAWQDTVSIIAALTMILGNVVAIVQSDIKRLLAYSSIAHAGYILMAVAAAGTFQFTADEFGTITPSFAIAQSALQGAVVYLMTYAFTNIGAFGVAIAVERDDATGTKIDDFAGLGRQNPLLAGAMSVFMFSLIGMPLTAGFVGKWFVFLSAVNANLTPLVLIGVVTSVISAFYYLRVIVKMWLEPGEGDSRSTGWLAAGVLVCAVATLVLGILPALLTNLAQTVTAVAMR